MGAEDSKPLDRPRGLECSDGISPDSGGLTRRGVLAWGLLSTGAAFTLSRNNAALADNPFTDHGDHSDAHADAAHADFHLDEGGPPPQEPHSDYHGDHPHYDMPIEHFDHQDINMDHQDYVDQGAHSDHEDHSDVPHDDNAHADILGPPHSDNPHTDTEHSDSEHYDFFQPIDPHSDWG